MIYRHELKYFLDYREYAVISSRVKNILKRDKNVGADGEYTVRSLYFDDVYNTAYIDKEAGHLVRNKHRIRIYNYSDKRISLEKKNKYERYNFKQSAPLTRELVEQILDGNYAPLLAHPSDLVRTFYYECVANLMRPRMVVDYEREPYIMEAGDVRVTFDKHIRAGVDGFNIFDSRMPTVEVMKPSELIMEVKYTEFLPNILRRILPSSSATLVSSSKYVICCDVLPHRRYSNG